MPRVLIERPSKFNSCYGCGAANTRGLGLQFFREDDTVVAELVPAPEHGGYGKLVHGGVTATVIDESFGWAIFGLLGKLGMTTTMTVEYSAALTCGETLTVRCRVVKQDEKEAELHSEVQDAKGRLAAVGRGTLRFISPRAVERLGGFKAGEIASS